MNTLIRLLYSVVIAGAFVAFLALGVYSFSQPPKYPDYPNYSYGNEAQYNQQQAAFNKMVDAYNQKEKHYYRNVTYVVVPLAAATAAVGVWTLRTRRFDVVSEGIALGGVGACIYAIIAASIAGANVLRFISAGVLLAALILIAHQRFSDK